MRLDVALCRHFDVVALGECSISSSTVMVWTLLTRLLAVTSGSPAFLARQFLPDDASLLQAGPSKLNDQYFEFPNEIKRVAVIGAGAAGVQHAAALVDHGFEVRLFERRPSPGGVWVYSPKKPLPAAFP